MIWIIAGTKNARNLITELLNKNYNLIATTATDYGKILLEGHGNLKILSGRMNRKEMIEMTKKNSVNLIIDASHPYSVELSRNAIYVSENMNISYLRFERKKIEFKEVIKFREYSDAADYLREKEGNILLTIGSKNIKYFSTLEKKRLFVRIVPFKGSIEECGSLGIMPGNIIAMSFKFSKEFNQILFRELNIKYMVTKESGEDGGVMEKIDAAIESGIEVIIIERPLIIYPEVHYDVDNIVKRVGDIYNG